MKILPALLIVFSIPAKADCFKNHIRESIEINKERKAIYFEASNGEASKVFNRLIFFEYLSLLPAAYYDARARKFHKAGIDLLCKEFKNAGTLPDFDPHNRTYPKKGFKPFNWRGYRVEINRALKEKDVQGIRLSSLEALYQLKESPHHLCMSRHLIESIYRFAYFTPMRIDEAQKKRISSPQKLLLKIIKLQLKGLKSAYDLDLKSRPLQDNGIPVLCNELPNLIEDLENEELQDLK